MALSSVLSLPLVPLFLPTLTLPGTHTHHRLTRVIRHHNAASHTHTITQSYFMRILRAMALSSPSRSCKVYTAMRANGRLQHVSKDCLRGTLSVSRGNITQYAIMGGGELASRSQTRIHTHRSLIFLLSDFRLGCFLIRLGCGRNRRAEVG